jgi:hypothetical protein
MQITVIPSLLTDQLSLLHTEHENPHVLQFNQLGCMVEVSMHI